MTCPANQVAPLSLNSLQTRFARVLDVHVSHAVTQPLHATATPAAPLRATAGPYEWVYVAPVGLPVDFGVDHVPAVQVRMMAVEPFVQATAARVPSAATAGMSVDEALSPVFGPHVTPASVETRALTEPFAFPIHETTTVFPLAAMRGMPSLPDVVDQLVVPSVAVVQVAARSRLILTRTDPEPLSVYAT